MTGRVDHMDLGSVMLAAAEAVEQEGGVPAWMFGVGGFAVLALMLFVVTRMNIDR